jgi:ATP-dependent Clp protease adaptor protein ClpS
MPSEVLDRPTIEQASQPKARHSPRYKVLLHNDDEIGFHQVVPALMEVVGMGEQKALSIALTAHQTGVGLVIICDLEPAEHYQLSLQARGLTVTLEPEE